METNKRQISLENKKINDLLYAQLLLLAEFDPKEQKLYLTRDEYCKNYDLLYAAAGLQSHRAPKKALQRRVSVLITLNLITKEEIMVNNKRTPAYIFPADKDSTLLIEKETLQLLVNTHTRFAVQIYSYLAEAARRDECMFTKSALANVLGYSKSNKRLFKTITDTLEVLKEQGFVYWEECLDMVYQDNGTCHPTTRMEILEVTLIFKQEKEEK